MLATEKATLYDLLKTSSAYFNGYETSAFSQKIEFTDDKPNTNDEAIPETSNITEVTATGESSTSMKSTSQTATPLTIEEVSKKVQKCTRCDLARTRTNTVPGMGVQNPLVMVIGEGPGADEDAQGLPFVGASGQLLDKMLAAIKLDRKTNCYIANIVKCRPPNNRTPSREEADTCIGFLQAQINILKPKMILCFGKTAANNLLKNELSISAMRGNFYDYCGIPVQVTYHPSALLRDASYKAPAWEDLKQFARKLKEVSSSYSELF